MRLVVDEHASTDTDGDLPNHLHHVHHWALRLVRDRTLEEMDLGHADDHDDLRRGCGWASV